MEFPRRNWAHRHRSSDIIDPDLEFGDLLDLSEPFSWQMPQPSTYQPVRRININRRWPRTEDRSRVHRRDFAAADTWRPETIDEVMADSSPNANPDPLTQFHGGAYAVDQIPSGGYMQRDSPFSLDTSIKVEPTENPSPTATRPVDCHVSISYIGDDGELANISGVELECVEQRCPLLALAVEHSKSGPKLYLEALTTATADPFARYLSTGSYALNSSDVDIFACVPTSLLLHCQLYYLGVLYDLRDLRSQANVNIIRQCEFGCSSPDKPIELCAAISYAYEHLEDHKDVLDTIVNYCVSCFLLHHLDLDVGFRQLAYDLRPFHQDLCRNSMQRGFENETAAAIIQMPFEPLKPDTYASREDIDVKAYVDVVHHFHGADDAEGLNKKRKRPVTFALPMRLHPRPAPVNPFESEENLVEDAVTSPFSDKYEIGEASTSRKRRASTITTPSIKSETDSEPEYELVAAPPAVEEVGSEFESDVDSAEGVALPRAEPTTPQPTSLPIRERAAGKLFSTAATSDPAHDSASDSDWSLV